MKNENPAKILFILKFCNRNKKLDQLLIKKWKSSLTLI